jgi:hypothetical protein
LTRRKSTWSSPPSIIPRHLTTMIRLRQTQTRWARSFPTVVASSIASYTCTYERGKGPCNKVFPGNVIYGRSPNPFVTMWLISLQAVTKETIPNLQSVSSATGAFHHPRTSTDTIVVCITKQWYTSVPTTGAETP